MIRNLKIQCPHCHSICELYLSTHAPIVILNCPDCWTPMLYNENGVYQLSQRQISEIVKNREFSIDSLLEKVAHSEGPDMRSASAYKNESFEPASSQGLTRRLDFDSLDRSVITPDEILDLRIDLATCADAIDFINKI